MELNNVSNSAASASALQERNRQTLENIQQLQENEQSLYKRLEDNTLSADEQKQIVMKINEISQMRLNLYATIKDVYEDYGTNMEDAISLSKQQLMAIKIVEKELNKAKVRMNALNVEKNNALRMVEINTYYGKQYNAQAQMMKTIALGCVPIILVSIIYRTGLISDKIFGFLLSLLLVILAFLVGRQWLDMRNRDEMNYDEYDWYFNPSTAPSSSSSARTNEDEVWKANETTGATCMGAACCYEGSKFDENLNVCIADTDGVVDADVDAN